MAERLHVTRQAISRWETDKSYPDLENLVVLGQLYQISIDELLGVGKEEVISEYVEENLLEEEEKSAEKAELDWKEQGIVFAVALVSGMFPLFGVIVPTMILWKCRKVKIALWLKVLCVICVLVGVYNLFITLNSWCGFWIETNVRAVD